MRRSNLAICLAIAVSFSAVCLCSAAEPAPKAAVEKFKKLQEQYQARDQVYRKQSEGVEPEKWEEYYQQHSPANTMVDDFLALERNERGNRVGLSCLLHLVRPRISFVDADIAVPKSIGKRQALVLLREHYREHPDLDLILKWVNPWHYAEVIHAEETVQLLKAAAESPHRHVRFAALYYLAEYHYLIADMVQTRSALRSLIAENEGSLPQVPYLGMLRNIVKVQKSFDETVDAEASRQAAIELLEDVRTKYADMPLARRNWNDPVLIEADRVKPEEVAPRAGESAAQMLFVLKNLLIGHQAPDIDRPDAFGKPLRLHDQRGKVTVLVFSYKGCGPCEAMYPDNRKLIEEMKGRPFALLGVMGDREIETTREVVETGKITWPVWWAGPDRELANKWNVRSYPQVYVIDHTGAIRYKGLREELLGRAVHKLVDDAEAAE